MLFLYDTKHGATEQILNNILEGIREVVPNIEVITVKHDFSDIDWNAHDRVIVMSPIYFGSPLKSIVDLLRENLNVLRQKDLHLIFIGVRCVSQLLNGPDTDWNRSDMELTETQMAKIKEIFCEACQIDPAHFAGVPLSYLIGAFDTRKLSEFEKKVMGMGMKKWGAELESLDFIPEDIVSQKRLGRKIAGRR